MCRDGLGMWDMDRCRAPRGHGGGPTSSELLQGCGQAPRDAADGVAQQDPDGRQQDAGIVPRPRPQHQQDGEGQDQGGGAAHRQQHVHEHSLQERASTVGLCQR